MRLIFTVLTFLVVAGTSAQIYPGFPPYNPDSDFNGIIGTDDLLSLLSIFGEQFDAYNTIVNEDTTFAAVFLGSITWPECQYSCDTLQGNWSIMDEKSIVHLGDTMVQNSGQYWHTSILEEYFFTASPAIRKYVHPNTSSLTLYNPESPPNAQCVCVARTPPLIEYDVVIAHTDDFEALVFEKLSHGWNLLGGLTISGWGNYLKKGQAFWRWAD